MGESYISKKGCVFRPPPLPTAQCTCLVHRTFNQTYLITIIVNLINNFDYPLISKMGHLTICKHSYFFLFFFTNSYFFPIFQALIFLFSYLFDAMSGWMPCFSILWFSSFPFPLPFHYFHWGSTIPWACGTKLGERAPRFLCSFTGVEICTGLRALTKGFGSKIFWLRDILSTRISKIERKEGGGGRHMPGAQHIPPNLMFETRLIW